MGILDSVIGALTGGTNQASPMGGQSSPLGGMLGSLLRGGQDGGGLSGVNPGTQGGGLGGLLSQFQQAGLGHIAQSWIGNGPNQSISPDQLQNVFGESRVRDMAQQAGVPTQDFLSQLSQHLPQAVDGMTPNGRLPDEGSVSV